MKPNLYFSLVATICLLFAPSQSFATNDEGVAMALEAATPYVKEGYKMRVDSWSGTIKAGGEKLVKHQLFRGNEYWFWAASSFPNSKATIGIYDDKGQSVALESFSKDGKSGVRVLPKKNGSYFIWVKIDHPTEKELDWGLVYGYR